MAQCNAVFIKDKASYYNYFAFENGHNSKKLWQILKLALHPITEVSKVSS